MSNEWKSIVGIVEQHDGVLVLRRPDGEMLMGDAFLDSSWVGQSVRVTIEVGADLPRETARSLETAASTAMHFLTEAVMLLKSIKPELRDGMAVHQPGIGEVQIRPLDYEALGSLSQRDWQLAHVVAGEVTRRLEDKLGKKNSASRKKQGGASRPRRK